MTITLNGTTGITTPDVTSDGLTVDSTTLVVDEVNNNVGIGTSSPARLLTLNSGASTGQLQITNSTSGTSTTDGFQIAHYTNGGTQLWNYENNYLAFGTNNTERARIDGSGNLLVGTTSPPTTGRIALYSNSTRTIVSQRAATTSNSHIGFYNPNGEVGAIYTNASSTIYSTSSDYRLKNTIAPMTGALARVSALKPCTYKWNADGSDGEGFIAHELAEVVPQCVTGEKDAVDAEGNPVYQGIDTSFLVATLTAAIQEQQAIIDDLTARVSALEATNV